jgi:hypothetical protein
MDRLALFSPTIVASLGTFSIPQSLLLSTPRTYPSLKPFTTISLIPTSINNLTQRCKSASNAHPHLFATPSFKQC